MVRNQDSARRIVEMLNMLIVSAGSMPELITRNDGSHFSTKTAEMLKTLNEIHDNALDMIKEEPALNTLKACESVVDSLKRIVSNYQDNREKALRKAEFELLPLLQDMLLNFYFWGCIWPDREKLNHFYENEMHSLSTNKYIEKAEESGNYECDISLCIIAFNKLEITKLCIESVLKAIPPDVKYELILINHGSTDDTRAYFESINPTKQLDISVNGGGILANYRIIEGRLMMNISNDVIVTQNSIHNMIKCMQSDEKIAWVVPSTPNVSNLQTIPASYASLEEMHRFAQRNNISDHYRWEQRTRLCNPIEMWRSRMLVSSKGIGWSRFHTNEVQSFPDDRMSLLIRRAGYKMMLAKDAYCYHFGSVTLKNELQQHQSPAGSGTESFYMEGRRQFQEAFGIDPWGTGFCWDPLLMPLLPCDQTTHVNILGINCGMGSNPLKIKETLKEKVHNLDVTLYNTTDDPKYREDLPGVSDIFEFSRNCSDIGGLFPGVSFDYVVFEERLEDYPHPSSIISGILNRINENGILAVKATGKALINEITASCPHTQRNEAWIVIINRKDYAQRPVPMKEIEEAESLTAEGKYVEAMHVIEGIIGENPHNSRILNTLGYISYSMGHKEKAARFFESAYDADPHNIETALNLLDLLEDLGCREQASAFLNRLKSEHPGHRDIAAYAEKCIEISPPSEMEQLLSEIEQKPADKRLLLKAADLFRSKNQMKKAAEYLEYAWELDTGDSETYRLYREARDEEDRQG